MYKKSQENMKSWLEKMFFYQDMLFGVLDRTGMIEDLDENNANTGKKGPIS